LSYVAYWLARWGVPERVYRFADPVAIVLVVSVTVLSLGLNMHDAGWIGR